MSILAAILRLLTLCLIGVFTFITITSLLFGAWVLALSLGYATWQIVRAVDNRE